MLPEDESEERNRLLERIMKVIELQEKAEEFRLKSDDLNVFNRLYSYA
jgi:hypothetical protein